jgi:hypothetical protein
MLDILKEKENEGIDEDKNLQVVAHTRFEGTEWRPKAVCESGNGRRHGKSEKRIFT